MTAVQAAMGLAQLEQLPYFIEKKMQRYQEYKEKITSIPGLKILDVPEYCKSNYWFYALFIDKKIYGLDRDGLMLKMEEVGIQCRPIWKLNCGQRPYRNNQVYRIEKAKYYFEHILNIPCSVGLTDEEINRVVDVLEENG